MKCSGAAGAGSRTAGRVTPPAGPTRADPARHAVPLPSTLPSAPPSAPRGRALDLASLLCAFAGWPPLRFNGWTLLSLALLLLGVGFWLYMGTTYGNWSDVGVYAVGITLVAFGLIGTLASIARPRTV